MFAITRRTTRRRTAGVPLALGVLLLCGPDLRAGLLTQVYLNPTGVDGTGAATFDGTSSAAGALSYEFVPAGAPYTSIFNGSGEATADYGRLGARAGVTLTDYKPGTYEPDGGPPTPFPAYASAAFTDTLTVSGGTGGGLLTFFFTVTGSTNDGPYSGSGVIVTFDADGNRVGLSRGQFSGDGSAVSDALPFTFGRPFDIEVVFFANVLVVDTDAPDPYSTFGEANFLNTLVLSGIRVTDSNGRPVDGVTITGASGTNYQVAAAAVPEPRSLALLVVGTLGAIVRRTTRYGRRAA